MSDRDLSVIVDEADEAEIDTSKVDALVDQHELQPFMEPNGAMGIHSFVVEQSALSGFTLDSVIEHAVEDRHVYADENLLVWRATLSAALRRLEDALDIAPNRVLH